ncbi:MAG TPA: sigma-54 dependent transcriptional regulator [Polyangiales bacterium]|jgi:two-component system response regulator HydG|nr:sigma-54 dependent transcriptional regulator [Polyangiales bacterium]
MQARLLLIDDDAAVCDAVSATLTPHDYDVVLARSGDDALAALERGQFDAVISDLNMPGMSGLELCRRAHSSWPDLPVVLVTAFGSMESAVGAIRAGAYDFISKPIQTQELLLTLSRALEHRQLKVENKQLRDTVARQRPSADMVGDSPVMRELSALLGRLSGTDATVLITGESGTGKELVAQAVHRRGPTRNGPMVAFNCAAVPETMLESELFGHARGAFTDAKVKHAGLFEQANGGTLFLDEIGEMPLGTQVKLLRALQERKVRPVGSDHEVPFDARVISATSRDLETDVAERRFREDLYYRINVIRIHIAPLRARGNDVLLIAEHFVERFASRAKKRVAGIAPDAAEKLLTYTWPGNVRELQNCMERAVALTSSESITLQDLPEHISACRSSNFVLPLENPLELLPMEEVEKRYVLQVLQALNGNRTEAAASLGFDRRTLYRKLKGYGIG